MSIIDDARKRATRAVDTARSSVRSEAAAGARAAVMPWVALSIVLSLIALSKRTR